MIVKPLEEDKALNNIRKFIKKDLEINEFVRNTVWDGTLLRCFIQIVNLT